ncbi:MAG: glycosyltransferase family 2 protein [Gemmatimonadetes bacterium]|nr:glycosyltransferase family 2 protein [Gemmatimonadota bacterium]
MSTLRIAPPAFTPYTGGRELPVGTPRVSVVMPVFNGEQFIAESVRSVLASELTDLELLVLDDGSTDGSVVAARDAAAGDARVRIIALPHGGVAAARNAGLREARAPLIANLDADDVMLPQRLSRQLAFLDANPEYVAIGSRALVIDAHGVPKRVGVRLFTHEEIDLAHIEGRGGAVWNPTMTFRKDVALRVGGYLDGLHTTGEDHDLWLRMAEVGKLANLPEVLIRYRIHGRNVSLSTADRERRLAVTLDTLRRAFIRRGITDREPKKIAAQPAGKAERLRDTALLRFFSGERGRALLLALSACVIQPTSPATWAALRVILREEPPRRSLVVA